jgi:hypothetical protein
MAQRKKWSELTTAQKGGVGFGAALQLTLLAAALWDMWRRPDEEINGPRRLWTLVVFINFIGPIAYFLFGRKNDL